MGPDTASRYSRAAHCALTQRAAGGPHDENPADPRTVQAMQLVLHLPKTGHATRAAYLASAARAVAALCLDPRAAEDDSWRLALHDWYDHRIRKVARRARNKAWDVAQGLPGITISDGGEPPALVRAFLPGPVSEVPPELRKLQISGTDLPIEDGAAREHFSIEDGEVLVAIDASLGMSLGKAAAQAGHASMLWAARRDESVVRPWAERGCPLRAVEVGPEIFARWRRDPRAVLVRDVGFTEVAPGSVTALALDTLSPCD